MIHLYKLLIFIYLLFVSTVAVTFSQTGTVSDIVITRADIEKAGTSIPVSSIGEPVGSVKLYPPRWVDSSGDTPAYAVVEGSIFPVDQNGWPINFRVILPAIWSQRSMQTGGSGNNGIIAVRERNNPFISKKMVLYGSDSGHQAAGRPNPGGMPDEHLATGPGGVAVDDWAVNEEAIRNLGYMQMKKTHDAAMVIMERIYGQRPLYNYYVGGSQGGREGLMVAQRYPDDYDGIISNVPIVNFSTLMLAPVLIRIQEKPLSNWITPTKINAIRAEFLRQCDKLDGLEDGIINNYMASRSIFDVTDGAGPIDPWAALRAPNGIDPNPNDTSTLARLTDGQIKTLELCYSPYQFSTPLANHVNSFGMWLPTVRPDDFGMITGQRYKGQEGAGEDAPVFTFLGALGVTGFLMQDIKANSLDYVEGGKFNKRREQLSEWLDATNPDLSAFYKRGGKLIMTIGTMDNVASSGAQIDYYQSIIDKMGSEKTDEFVRMYVVPQGGHGLSGRSFQVNGAGKEVETRLIPAPDMNDNLELLIGWVEKKQAPLNTLVIDQQGRIRDKQEGKGYLLCSYPSFPKYIGGPAELVTSYVASMNE